MEWMIRYAIVKRMCIARECVYVRARERRTPFFVRAYNAMNDEDGKWFCSVSAHRTELVGSVVSFAFAVR